MRKIRFTEHQIIAVLKSVEAERTVRMFAVRPLFRKPAITTGRQSMAGWKRSILKKSKIWKTRIGGLNRCLLISVLSAGH